MYLKRIEIQGFKSFAEPVAIDFKEGITCIIGPNGSGKSNISDAMRWVLGEQSVKTLRGGKMEEIIFAGTDSKRSKGMAEVTLIFDNTTGVLGIDYSEVAIRRRLFRSGESEYFINGNQCRLRDIRELIMDTGIGVDGYSFIGQGRVDKIVSDKPETRREVFEEAAGIIKYKSKKAEAERKIENASGNLDRINDIVIDIESRIDDLRTESEKAIEHADLIEKYRELEINITLKNIDNLQAKNEELLEQFDVSEKNLINIRNKKIEMDARLASLRARDEELEIKSNDHREEINNKATQILNIKNSSLLTEEKKKSIERDRERLTTETEELSAKLVVEEQALSRMIEDRKNLESLLESSSNELSALIAKSAEKESRYSEKVKRIDDLKSQMFEDSRNKAAKEAELASSTELIGNIDETEDSINQELQQNVKDKESVLAQINELKSACDELSSDVERLNKESEEAQQKYDKANSTIADKRNQSEEIKLELEKKSTRQKTIEEMESNYEGYNSGVRMLMKNKSSGIYGVVAELVSASSGYEVAIETALGATLQNIICDSDSDAKKSIEFLKTNQGGRLTFLPVKSIKKQDARTDKVFEGMHGFCGYALDLVEFDDKFENVFNYLLGKVVVTETLDDAIAMSKKNEHGYRIVTREGEVINPAGALTGGSHKHKSANLLARKNEIESLRQEIEDLDKQRDLLKKELETLEKESETLLAKIKDNATTVRDKESSLIRSDSERKSAQYRLEGLSSRIEKGQTELQGIENDRKNSSGMMQSLGAEIEKLSDRIKKVSSEIEDEMGNLHVHKQESDSSLETVTTIRLAVAKHGANKQNADKVIASAETALEEMKSLADTKRLELKSLERIEIDTLSDDSADTLETLEADKKKIEDSLESVSSERMIGKRTIEESELKAENFSNQIDAAISTKNAMEVELGRQDTRLSTWKEKLFEEFELSHAHAMEFRDPNFVMSSGMKENKAIKDRLKEIGEVNPGSIKDYEETSERYEFLTVQRDDVLSSMNDLQNIVKDMDKISVEKFTECFDKIAESFSETFTLLFGGGKGEIFLEDENNPLESGIEIKVRPPGKASLVSIDGYSGGERAMIAIALLFSILKAKPTPFCILDEIDAALDETNIHRFANYVASLNKETQFALVTHQRSTMEYADALFGVTMQEKGVTSILSLLLGDKATEEFAEKLN